MRIETAEDIERIDFDKGDGLVPTIVQDAGTGTVLMVAWADRQAVARTLERGEMCFWSRSRGEPWHKGATSGNRQRLVELQLDCDGDTLLARVVPAGPACHTGAPACFDSAPTLVGLDRVIAERAGSDAASSYTARLHNDRNLRLKKLGEEAAELAVAAADGDGARVTEEAADLLYHLLVVARAAGSGLDEITAALARRAGQDYGSRSDSDAS